MVLAIAVLGLVVGSWLNVVIGRLRSGERGWRSRSQCPRCHAVLTPSELVPLVSFIALRGRCRSCRGPISWQYPLVELSTMLLFVSAYGLHGGLAGVLGGQWPLMLRDMAFFAVLTVVFVIDLLDMVVFDSVTIPATVAAFAANVALGHDPLNLLLAVLVGAGFFLLQWVISKGAWIGGGDVRIGAMIGAMVGFPGVVAALFLAYVSGAAVALGLMAAKRAKWSGQMAFGTFLSAAAAVVLYFGERLWGWYGALLGF